MTEGLGIRYHTLDAMRGVAAGAVVLFHIRVWLIGDPTPSGYLAVDFFFALSGFVISHSYQSRLERDLSLRRFTELRLVRLYPLIALGCSIGLAESMVDVFALHRPNASQSIQLAIVAISNSIMVPAPLPLGWLFPLNIPAWSLFFELLINMLYGAIMFRLGSRVVILFVLMCAAVLIVGAAHEGSLNLGWGWSSFDYGFARVGFSFALGMLFARWHRTSSRRTSRVALLLAAALLPVLLTSTRPEIRPVSDLIVVLLILPTLLWLGTYCEMPSQFNGIAGLLGDISYPLYATHFPLMIAMNYLQHLLHLSTWSVCVSFGLGACLFAWLAGRFYDGPLRKWISDGRAETGRRYRN